MILFLILERRTKQDYRFLSHKILEFLSVLSKIAVSRTLHMLTDTIGSKSSKTLTANNSSTPKSSLKSRSTAISVTCHLKEEWTARLLIFSSSTVCQGSSSLSARAKTGFREPRISAPTISSQSTSTRPHILTRHSKDRSQVNL